MLHPINPAAEAELRNVLAFQRRVLEFALLPGLTVQRVPQGQNGKVIIRIQHAEVDAHFGAHADWFWTHRSLHTLVVGLNDVVRGNAALAAQVLAAFDNDVDFDNHINDPAFTFQCCTLPNVVFTPLQALLEKFYDILVSGGGYSHAITTNGVLTRSSWLATFWGLHPNSKVCPACDDKRSDVTDNKIHAQCDHYFPKSKHAALSVHPRNLIPICTHCNEDFKGDHDANDQAHLSEMFLPYGRAVFGPIVTRVSRHPRKGLTLTFDDGGSSVTSRLQSLDYILKLQERWTNRVRDHIAPKMENTVRHQWSLIQRLGGNPAVLLDDISAQRTAANRARGSEIHAVATEAYWTFLEYDPQERATILA